MFIGFLFTDKQTGTIERQNELNARQSEILATISSMITNQNENSLLIVLSIVLFKLITGLTLSFTMIWNYQ